MFWSTSLFCVGVAHSACACVRVHVCPKLTMTSEASLRFMSSGRET